MRRKLESQVVCCNFGKDGQGRPEKVSGEQTPEGRGIVRTVVEEEGLGFGSLNYRGEA